LSAKEHFSQYDEETTLRCERVLITLIGDIGIWSERIYLVGGLAPRYLVGAIPAGVAPHVGTTDVDVVIGLAVGDETPETYKTLQANLKDGGFKQSDPSFRWIRDVDGVAVSLEFMCETDDVGPGEIFTPKGEGTGSKMGAFNVRGAQLVRDDFIEATLEGERLDGGGRSKVKLRVAGLLPYVVLKIFAFQTRHENKDAYDLVFTLLNSGGGPAAAGGRARLSPIAGHAQVLEAMQLLEQRFHDVGTDGPSAYALFVSPPDDEEALAQARQRAVATVRQFLTAFRG
jgi:hypothetical protein